MGWYDGIIRYSLWLLIFISIWLILSPIIVPNVKKVKLRINFKSKKRKQLNPISKHIRKLLGTALNQTSEYSILSFYFISFILALLSFVAFLKNGWGTTFTLIYTVVAGLLPYLLLKVKIHMIQVSASYEGGPVLNELVNNYKIYHENINMALEVTVSNLENYETSRKVFNRLAFELLDYQTEEELKDIIERFQYSIGTKWGDLLGNLIFNAALYGDKIQEGITDIIKDLHKLESINEKNKQNNIEGELMFFIFVPLMIIGSFYAMFQWFGFTISKFIDYQFLDKLGFSTFVYSVSSIIITIVIYLYLKRTKNDF